MDLSTTYMGLSLKNPMIPSASPLSENLDHLKAMEDHGAAAVVLHSIFEEQVRHDRDEMEALIHCGDESFPEALSYFPEIGAFRSGTDDYLDLITRAKAALEIPVIASLNGSSPGGWVTFAARMAEAGADGVELNLYRLSADPGQDAAALEEQYLDIVKTVRRAVTLPLALKLSPFFTSMAHMANAFAEAGADALALFNRFYQPDLDIEGANIVSSLQLSTPAEMRLPLRWIGLLSGRISASLAGSTGVDGAREALKYLMAGADAVMTTSALLRHGIPHLQTILKDMADWMESHEYASLSDLKGRLSQKEIRHPSAFERAQYIKVLENARHSTMI